MPRPSTRRWRRCVGRWADTTGRAAGPLAAGFQATIAQVTREILAETRNRTGVGIVCLSGGVFQNRTLLEKTAARLEPEFTLLLPEQVPANDGGIALGQAAVALARQAQGVR